MSISRKTTPRIPSAGEKPAFLRSNNLTLRKAALSASAASRRGFPAWIAADEAGVAFPAKAATPRVRAGLVLRTVSKKKSAISKGPNHGTGAR